MVDSADEVLYSLSAMWDDEAESSNELDIRVMGMYSTLVPEGRTIL